MTESYTQEEIKMRGAGLILDKDKSFLGYCKLSDGGLPVKRMPFPFMT